MKKNLSSPGKHPSSNDPGTSHLSAILCYGIAVAFYLAAMTKIICQAMLRGLWNDEIISIGILKRPFLETMQAAYSGYDGMLPLFYFLSWPIVALFPHYDFAARWLQIIPALTAPILVFWWVKNRISLSAAAVSVMPIVWFYSQYTHLAWHLRAYGFFLFATAAAIILLDTAPDRRSKLWMASNAIVQFLLVSGHPFGIFYCGLLAIARWISDFAEHGIYFDRKLMISYVPSLLGVIAWTPAILASRRLMEPIPWQPVTTLTALPSALLPSIESPWPLLFASIITISLISGKSVAPQKPLGNTTYLTLVPLACLLGTLAVWAYSLQKPLYLDRYFSPNVWAWAIIIALAYWRLESFSTRRTRLSTLFCALLFGGLTCVSVMRQEGLAATKKQIELTHVLLQGTRDDEIVDARFPVFLFDFNVFMERHYYNPKTLDYRAVFNAAEQPPNPKKSLTERLIAEGMVSMGMEKDKLLTVHQAAEVAAKIGGANVLGIKRTEETMEFLEIMKARGYLVQSRTLDIGGSPLFWDVARRH